MPTKKKKIFRGSTRVQGHDSVRKIWNSVGNAKLDWYCQVCEKQCRDEMGFRTHCSSEFHQKQMLIFAKDADKFIEKYSEQFHSHFMQILSTSFKTNRSKLLDVYQVMIDDPHHVHLNATKWEGEIEEYAKYLGRNSFCKVEQTPEGLYITWIDRSMTVMNKEMAIEKKKTVEVSEQQREMQELERQIKRAERSLETSISTASSILAPQDKKIKIELKSSSVKPNPLKRKPLK